MLTQFAGLHELFEEKAGVGGWGSASGATVGSLILETK
jgi:hypothetical protein